MEPSYQELLEQRNKAYQAISEANWILSNCVDAGGGIKALKGWVECERQERIRIQPIYDKLWVILKGDSQPILNRKNLFELIDKALDERDSFINKFL